MNVQWEAQRIDQAIKAVSESMGEFRLEHVLDELGNESSDVPADQMRAMVRMRLAGEPLLGGLSGVVQRVNAVSLGNGGKPLGAEAAIEAMESARPGASMAEITTALGEFVEHLHREGERLAREAEEMQRMSEFVKAHDPHGEGITLAAAIQRSEEQR